MSDTNDNIIELHDENGELKVINGEPIYYTTSQIAEMLGESDSTIRFWCKEYEELLNIEKSGRNRRFTKKNIEQLEYIKKLLKEENLSIKQVKEYLSTRDSSLIDPALKESDQVIIKAISQVLLKEMNTNFKELQKFVQDQTNPQNLLGNISTITKEDLEEQMSKQNELIKEQKELIEKQKEDFVKELNKQNELIEKKLEERENDLTEKIAERMREQIASENKKLTEYIAVARDKEEKKGFFSKLFGK